MDESMHVDAVHGHAASKPTSQRGCRRSSPSCRACHESELHANRVLSRAGPRLAVSHPGEHGDPQDLRRQGRVPRPPRGRLDTRSGRRSDRRPSCPPRLAPPAFQCTCRSPAASARPARRRRARGGRRSPGAPRRPADGADVAPTRDAAGSRRVAGIPLRLPVVATPAPRPVLRRPSRQGGAVRRTAPRSHSGRTAHRPRGRAAD